MNDHSQTSHRLHVARLRGYGVRLAGLGVRLGGDVRDNGFWPSEVVTRWREASVFRGFDAALAADLDVPLTPAVRGTVAGVARHIDDPFCGFRERRVLGEAEAIEALEVEAAREALDRANVAADDVDLVIVQTTYPEDGGLNRACGLHARVGLSQSAIALTIQAHHNSFMQQLSVASAYLGAGLARTALLVQSAASSRAVPMQAEFSPWFSDVASAAVVVRAPGNGGVGVEAHGADGQYSDAYGKPAEHDAHEFRVLNMRRMQRLLLQIVDVSADAVGQALAAIERPSAEVGFLACHQPTPWFRELLLEHAGLTQARTIDSLSTLASLGPCTIPYALDRGVATGALKPDDLVAMVSGGGGQTWSAILMRWS